jgi:phosphoserine phosphatase
MQEMISLAFPREPHRFLQARKAFSLQTQGQLSMEETFRIAGEATKGLPLRVAIDYVTQHMAFVHGYGPFIAFLLDRGIHCAVISTGYSVTLYAIRHGMQAPPFKMCCNRLLFSHPSVRVIGEEELEALVKVYLHEPERQKSHEYDSIRANGQVILGIQDETEKARLALHLAQSLGVPPSQVAHMGDTMGDSGGIIGVARAGGLGIAFNYNEALEAFLHQEGKKEIETGRIVLVDSKGPEASLTHVLPYLESVPHDPMS